MLFFFFLLSSIFFIFFRRNRYQERVKIVFEKLILGDEDVRYDFLLLLCCHIGQRKTHHSTLCEHDLSLLHLPRFDKENKIFQHSVHERIV